MPMDGRRQRDEILNATDRVSLESVEALPAKHRREKPSADFSVEGPFDQLPDDLTEEILCRLPLRSVLRSRCVCTGWLSLTKSPQFLQLLERRHNLLEKDPPVGLLLLANLLYRDARFVVCSGVPKSKCFKYSDELLPPRRRRDYDRIVLRGSCDDLLLCCEEWAQGDYFIMNSVTRERAALPPILGECYESVLTGLVCDPTSIPEAKKGAKLRFRVVQIPITGQSETELKVVIFSSEDSQWNEYVMRCDVAGEMQFCGDIAVACNGSLYWKFRRRGGKIMALDPFNPMKNEVVVIESPPDSLDEGLRAEHLGIHRGKLRMSRRTHSVSGFRGPLNLYIWELQEGKGGAEWRSIKEFSLETIIAANPSYVNHRKSRHLYNLQFWETLAFHPIDGDIIFFGCTLRKKIISCNMKTSRLKIVCDFNFYEWFSHWSVVFPIVMPCYPTPVPSLPNF